MAHQYSPSSEPHEESPLAIDADKSEPRENLLMLVPNAEESIWAGNISCCGPRPEPRPDFLRWDLVAPPLRQKHRLPPKIFEEYWPCTDKLRSFARLVKTNDHFEEDREEFFPGAVQPETSKCLEGLPTELLALIFGSLGPMTLISLALCSKRLWNIVLQHIRARIRWNCWAGLPIICVAETKEDGLSDELTATRDAMSDYQEIESIALLHVLLEAFVVDWEDQDIDFDVEDEYVDDDYDDTSTCSDWRVPASLKPKAKAALRDIRKPFLCETWILRNINTREVVRLRLTSAPLLERHHDWFPSPCSVRVHVESEPRLSLDEVLLKRICWVGPCNGREETKAEWARHRFDIVPREHAGIEEGWVDITATILEKASLPAVAGPH